MKPTGVIVFLVLCSGSLAAPGSYADLRKSKSFWQMEMSKCESANWAELPELRSKMLKDVKRQLRELSMWNLSKVGSTEQMVAAVSLVPVQLEWLESLAKKGEPDWKLAYFAELASGDYQKAWKTSVPASVSLATVKRWLGPILKASSKIERDLP